MGNTHSNVHSKFFGQLSCCTKVDDTNVADDTNVDVQPKRSPTAYCTFNNDLPADVTLDDTIPFIPCIQQGRVIKVYDGDTITIASKLPIPDSPIYRFQVRLDRIDTPEMKSKSTDERDVALAAKDALTQLIFNKTVTLKYISIEKYGRLLADVYCDNVCINDWMIEQRYAVPYDGGKKITPKSWKKYNVTGNIV